MYNYHSNTMIIEAEGDSKEDLYIVRVLRVGLELLFFAP